MIKASALSFNTKQTKINSIKEDNEGEISKMITTHRRKLTD